ncbi:AraC family transcriptional regulator [Subsaxibacter sp. CAU 1640]|uniref:helix-turn-helix domain-containing protein n=1 Tax=Subsaxibacter sp. CAU 1640 TaxID=2933271 RepID=UPI0020032BB9|nr:AraC family transcriptional regulator [Subsaxibacter sp. CAU 1640]MCK7590623.1 AraC family transcriptional regulator [Subsaxibacter sp. CAU 1640]
MKTIVVNSLPLMDVIKDFARLFKTDFVECCEDYRVKIPRLWGSGEISGINFPSGIGLLQYDCTFKEDLEVHFVVNDVHPLKFLFCLEGSFQHRFEGEDNIHDLGTYQNCMIANQHHSGHVLYFKAGVKTTIQSIEVDRKRFNQKMACDIKNAEPRIKEVLLDVYANETFYHEGYYSYDMGKIFDQMQAQKEQGLIKKIFLEGRSFDIFANQLLQYKDDDMEASQQHLLRRDEVKSIHQAVAIIESSMATLGTVKELSKEVGLNPNKLQNGFQTLYGQTVNEFIQKIRLEAARNLLTQTPYSVQEIMERVGWNSKSYFSQIFKDTFGMTPSEFRKKHQKAR